MINAIVVDVGTFVNCQILTKMYFFTSKGDKTHHTKRISLIAIGLTTNPTNYTHIVKRCLKRLKTSHKKGVANGLQM